MGAHEALNYRKASFFLYLPRLLFILKCMNPSSVRLWRNEDLACYMVAVCDILSDAWRAEHVSDVAKKLLRAQIFFCNSAPRLPDPTPSFSATPAHRSAPLHLIFSSLRSVFRSAHMLGFRDDVLLLA